MDDLKSEDKSNKRSEEEILAEARKRFSSAADFESDNRREMLDDIKFVRLGDQWPDYVKRDREQPGRERPMHTINRLFQFRNQVINEIRQNSPGIKIRPVDDNADIETAEMIEGVIRHIEASSRADIAYDTAAEWQVDAGLGYFRIVTEYCDNDGFDQEIRIDRVPDMFRVYYDPASTEPDGSDARYCFIAYDMPRAEAESEYPDAEITPWPVGGDGDSDGWVTQNTVRVSDYYSIENEKKTLVLLNNGESGYKEDLPDDESVRGMIVKERDVEVKRCIWRKICGNKVLDEAEIPCSHIPVIPVVGSEIWVEGKRYLHGLTRFGKDPARQYNYLQSAATEYLALAPRSPFIAAEGQLDGYEAEWSQANRVNFSVLTYRIKDSLGMPITAAPPQRQPPPGASPGFEAGMARAVDDMKASMGIYDASLGNRESDQSGRAILSQQQQASVGNFHFSDNLSRSLRQAGRIMLEMGFTHPKHIYDTPRVMQILGYDGQSDVVRIDPNQPKAMQEYRDAQGKVQKLFNPNIGKYDVSVDTGPSYTSKRTEAAAAMMQFVQADPAILGVAGDLIVRNMDWPGAQQIAERMKKALPPNLRGDENDEGGQDPRLMQAQQQMQQMSAQMEHMSQALQETQQQDTALIQKLQAENQALKTDRQIEMGNLALEQQKFEIDKMRALRELQGAGEAGSAEANPQLELEQWKAQLYSQTKIRVAEIASETRAADRDALFKEKLLEAGKIEPTGEPIMSRQEILELQSIQQSQVAGMLNEIREQIAAPKMQVAGMLNELKEQIAAPKITRVERDKNGRMLRLVQVTNNG